MGRLKKTTLDDVALKAGVSKSTVSRVINGEGSVGENIRVRVLSAVSALNYDIKQKSRPRNRIVGLVIPNIRNPFYSEVIGGIESVAKIHDCHIVLCDSEESLRMETDNIRRLIRIDVDGILLAACEGKNTAFDSISAHGIPVVCVDRRADLKNPCIVESDNEEGAYQATKYLLNLGHRSIVFVAGPMHQSTIQERLAGYRRALEEYSVSCDDAPVLRSDGLFSSTCSVFKSFLEQGRSMSAVFTGNDIMAFAVRKVCEDNGIRIPDDVALIGYDDIQFAESISLTTVAQPMHDMGRNAMIMLIDLLEGRITPPQRQLLHSRMVIRDSCRPKYPAVTQA